MFQGPFFLFQFSPGNGEEREREGEREERKKNRKKERK